MKAPLCLPSPAKLNLFLHILGRREDGYHNLQTVFQLLDVVDDITLTAKQSNDITLTNTLEGVNTQDNLMYKAAQLLQRHSNVQYGVDISCTKRLPMGGGLGGGSSNAATVLLGLNRLWNLGLSIKQLAELGRSLGADVPVFIEGHSAWAEGIGEKLQAIDLPERWFVVVKPACSISTQHVFSHKELTRNTPPITVAAFLKEGGNNDCQRLVEQHYPQVKDAVDWLNQHGKAQLTGTGACLFSAFESEDLARSVFAARPVQLEGFVAKGLNRSPVHQLLQY